MPEVTFEIESCKKCPFWKEGPTQSTDGFDRGHDWFCTKSNNRLIEGFVEWRDKPEIPKWCPILKSETVDTEEAIDVLKFVLNFKKSDGDYLTIYGGLFYWNSDDDGDFPMDQKDVYQLFLEHKKKQISCK